MIRKKIFAVIKSIAKAFGIKSTITEKGETHEFTRYFITSLTDLDEFSDSVRKHWSIENQLH